MIRARLLAAIEALRHNDEFLLEIRCHERSVAGRLQMYLTGVFPSHNVDTEYNRHGVDTKRVPLGPPCRGIIADDAPVVPDVIVHRRGDDRSNVLVIEIKLDDCGENELECDRQKLAAIKRQFGYLHSALLQFPTGPNSGQRPTTLEWNGDRHRVAVAYDR